MSSIDTVRRATAIAWNTGLPMAGLIDRIEAMESATAAIGLGNLSELLTIARSPKELDEIGTREFEKLEQRLRKDRE